MKRVRILSIMLCAITVTGFRIPVMASDSYAEGANKKVSDDYINPVPSKQIIDVTNENVLPLKFRTTKDVVNENKSEGVDLTGLNDLNMSGSKTPSENALKLIKESTSGYKLYDVDLRQESHGILDGMVISWYGERDDQNRGLSEEEVLTDEKNRLKKIKEAGHAEFDVLPKGKSVDIKEVNNITTVQTEEELAESLGIGYIRIQVSDHYKPEAEHIDQFINFVNGLPDNAWLHFHCRGGAGRTTTFMCMYDMMKNAKKVSFEDIVKRQAVIGGENLLEGNTEDKANPGKTRADALRDFYKYCRENNDNYKISYSQYKKSKEKVKSVEEDVIRNQWIKNSNSWSYADETGKYISNSWKEINYKWYHFNKDAVMDTGWYKDNNSKWYYLNLDGSMKTGWFRDDNLKWYYLKNNGEMAVSECIDGFWVNENGEWNR